MKEVLERFLEYVKIDTQSDESKAGECCPTTEKQRVLAKKLTEELKELGAKDVVYDEKNCYVYGAIPASEGMEKAPVLGFIAHMDTSPEVSGANVKPQVIADYAGEDIVLNEEEQIVLKTADFPEVKNYIGQTLVVTDGTTLLGADDKAGVAEIMTLAELLLENPDLKHGEIRIGFTPDEEVGQGADLFDLKLFGADFAYTVDGGPIGELEYENFNAASGKLTVSGRSVHPGDAKNKMLNSILLAQEFQSMLPYEQSPQYTEKYEGFFHVDKFEGTVEKTMVEYIIRDHDMDKFEEKKRLFTEIGKFLNEKYHQELFYTEVRDSYYNMKEKIKPHMHLIENAKKAMEQAGVTPIVVPIRGGTDGARLSYEGLPCPNLCTGGHNYHGRYEYVCVESMEKVVEVLKHLCVIYSMANALESDNDK